MAQWLPIENKKSTQFSCHMKGQGQTYELHTHDQKPYFMKVTEHVGVVCRG